MGFTAWPARGLKSSTRRRAAIIVRRHSRAGRLAGVGEFGISGRLFGNGMPRIRLLRGLGALLVGGLLVALLVPDNALTGMCHRWFHAASMAPATYFAGADHRKLFRCLRGAGNERNW